MSRDPLTLEQLGLDRQQLQERLIEAVVSGLLEETAHDDEGHSYPCASDFARGLRDRVQEALDARIEAIAQEHIIPHVSELVEKATLQRTNEWGEERGEPLTFTEYLVQRAQDYLTEPVDFEGKPVGRSPYRSKDDQTRLTHLVNRYLHYGIETAMKQAVAEANKVLAGALAETARMKLAEIAEQLQVKVEPRR